KQLSQLLEARLLVDRWRRDVDQRFGVLTCFGEQLSQPLVQMLFADRQLIVLQRSLVFAAAFGVEQKAVVFRVFDMKQSGVVADAPIVVEFQPFVRAHFHLDLPAYTSPDAFCADVLETTVDYLKSETLEQLPDVLVGLEVSDESLRDLIVTHNGSCCLRILSRAIRCSVFALASAEALAFGCWFVVFIRFARVLVLSGRGVCSRSHARHLSFCTAKGARSLRGRTPAASPATKRMRRFWLCADATNGGIELSHVNVPLNPSLIS